MSYFDNYTPEEIKNILKYSSFYKDFARKIGYSNTPSGDTLKMLQKKLVNYDTSHFQESVNKTLRTEENTFVENSTASQSSLRKLYFRGNYTPYLCSICGQKPIWNGKALTLVLDHINGVNNDDRLENLRWVCPNCNQQLETTGSRNPNRKIFAKKYYCIDCGKEISKGQRCRECQAKSRIIPEDKMPVSREELKSLIRTKTFVDIGKQFGVSDNAIRKWCDKFNLPRKKIEITKYSEEDWSKI